MTSFLLHIVTTLLLSILKVVCLLVAIAYFTLAERKIMAAVQRRVGPNVVGPFGLLQPLADGLKLAGKELAIPAQASSRIFLSVAITVLLFALSGWSAIPFGMFDHSEHMDNSVVAKILVLTEPRNLTLQERWAIIDAHREMYPRGYMIIVDGWQAFVEYAIAEFQGKFDVIYSDQVAEEFIDDGSVSTEDYWAEYLDARGHSPEAVAYVQNIRETIAAVSDAVNKSCEAVASKYKE